MVKVFLPYSNKEDAFSDVVIEQKTFIYWLDFVRECNNLISHLKRCYNSYKTHFGVDPFE